jgi:hypothetical protein
MVQAGLEEVMVLFDVVLAEGRVFNGLAGRPRGADALELFRAVLGEGVQSGVKEGLQSGLKVMSNWELTKSHVGFNLEVVCVTRQVDGDGGGRGYGSLCIGNPPTGRLGK